jgi:hypothetical protein
VRAKEKQKGYRVCGPLPITPAANVTLILLTPPETQPTKQRIRIIIIINILYFIIIIVLFLGS